MRDSVRTGRNFSPARNVLSCTVPSSILRSLVRTKAPPLPGLTCWNSMIRKIVPSISMCEPFLNWLVLITAANPREAARAADFSGAQQRAAGPVANLLRSGNEGDSRHRRLGCRGHAAAGSRCAGRRRSTRAQYVEQVEPICQANTEANKRILKNVKTKARSKQTAKVKAGRRPVHPRLGGLRLYRDEDLRGAATGSRRRPPAQVVRIPQHRDRRTCTRSAPRSRRATRSRPPTKRSGSNAAATPPTTSASSSTSSYCRITPSRFI